MQELQKVDLAQKFSLFEEQWTPKIVGELNGQQVKLAKVEGEFVWHDHAEEDELFLVVHGELTLRLRDSDGRGEREVHLEAGQFFIVPRGVEHQPYAAKEAHIMLFEPKSTGHTGKVESELTVHQQDWI